MTVTLPDTITATRDWLRSLGSVTALVSSSAINRGGTVATFPRVEVFRVGGGDDTSEAPIDRPLVQVECWAESYTAARVLANVIRAECIELRPTEIATGVWLYGAECIGDVDAPDPDLPNRHRVVLTLSITARSN